MLDFKRHRVLIWGKTYPELSTRHKETVCTGGCDEHGRPIRLYPVPLRYLPDDSQYSLYNWIDVPMARNEKDPRPESYKVLPESIVRGAKVGTAHGWEERRKVIFADPSWHYGCLEDLKAAQKTEMRSLGLVRVGSLDDVKLVERGKAERTAHQAKLKELKSATDLFGYDQKDLDFFPYRVRAHWHCSRLTGPKPCPGHTAAVLDWGLGELGRKKGGPAARDKMESLGDLARYDLHFFVGNFFLHQGSFGVIGLWYPLKGQMVQRSMFTPS